jgi:hypothetical protein
MFSGNDLDKQAIVEPEWESYLKETAKIILQRPNQDG